MSEDAPHDARASETVPFARSGWATMLVAIAGVLPTLGRFANGLVFDDRFVIGEGTFIFDRANLARVFVSRTMAASSLDAAVGSPPLDTYRPVTILTFFWDAWLSGRSPLAYHVTNMVLHACVVALLHRCVLASDRRGPALAALWAALAFAWSPWLSEAHVWIDGRSDVVCGLFVLLCVLAQGRALLARQRPLAWSFTAALFLLLGLMSKEAALVLAPVVALVPVGEPIALRTRAARGAPLALGVIAYFALRSHALNGARLGDPATSLTAALPNAGVFTLDALSRALVPTPYFLRNVRDDYQSIDLSLRIALVLLVAVLVLVALFWAHRHGFARVSFGLSFFLVTLAPAIAITTASWPGFGRFLYLPSLGLAFALAELVGRVEASDGVRWRIARALMATHLVVSAALMVRATASYRDDATLFTDAIDARPDQAWTYGFLGLALAGRHECEAALPALEAGSVGDPTDPRFSLQFGRCLLETGRATRARDVAIAGEERFRDTRAEAGFLLLHAATLTRAERPRVRELLERCLLVVPERADCRAALDQVEREER